MYIFIALEFLDRNLTKLPNEASIYLSIYLSVILFLAGCSEINDPEIKEQEDLKKAVQLKPNTNARSTQGVYYFTDWSGQIEIAVSGVNSWMSPGHAYVVSTVLPSDYVLVGGGAYPVDVEPSGGAYLVGSWPDLANNRWYGSSKDHGVSDPHSIMVYAVGLKIQGVSPATLRSVMTQVQKTSSIAPHPFTNVSVPTGYKLIGGGAKVNWTPGQGSGNLLVYSYPMTDYTWNVQSKDHEYPDPKSITAYAIGIKDFIPGFGYIDLNRISVSTYNSTGGYANVYLGSSSDYVVSCVGASAQSPGSQLGGRLLTAMRPGNGVTGNNVNSLFQSADCMVYATGWLYGYAITVKKRP